MTIYDIPGIVNTALPLAVTQNNIVSGFKVSGIFPFNRLIFSESEFIPSTVTDRPSPNAPTPDQSIPSAQTPEKKAQKADLTSKLDKSGMQTFNEPGPSTLSCVISPLEILRPFPKAPPRKPKKATRKKRSTAILTDTPVKDALEEEKAASKRKLALKTNKKGNRKTKKKTKKKIKKTKKRLTKKNGNLKQAVAATKM
ncbi:hypothetical protein NQ314_002666 [Rhamnusium bicolor]|uniref:Uncharacterized protein n=1 Tax=Rhamnusium bicolor TaxID=1586634 RepID=A0AAV8ZPH6_9CUCU|nr:hypothetical protein NQ314_002666 [Rhamnusium bicolor]